MSRDALFSLYRRMLPMRLAEEGIVAHYAEQEMRCPVHLHIGQEAPSASVAECVQPEIDRVFGTHRSHGPYLALDGSLEAFFGELYGKQTGCCRGRGGSMHLIAKDSGYWGSSALVGGVIPIAVGAALAARQQGTGGTAVCFFGDGAVDEGVFYESMSFAALRRLPVLFLCENNFYATLSRQRDRQLLDNIPKRAQSFGVPSERVDGNDVVATHAACHRAFARARDGQGPSLIEARTYRWMAHVGPSPDARSQNELQQWQARCPLMRCEQLLLSEHGFSDGEIAELHRDIEQQVQSAIAHAQEAPFPDVAEFLAEAEA